DQTRAGNPRSPSTARWTQPVAPTPAPPAPRCWSTTPCTPQSAVRSPRPQPPACATTCVCPHRSRSCKPSPLSIAARAELRRTHLSGGDATLLSSHAGDPRAATDDTTGESQTSWSTPSLRVTPSPTRGANTAGRTTPPSTTDSLTDASLQLAVAHSHEGRERDRRQLGRPAPVVGVREGHASVPDAEHVALGLDPGAVRPAGVL